MKYLYAIFLSAFSVFTIAQELPCVPEISANKYALNIRFTTQEGGQRPRAADTDVEFELTFCSL